MNQDRWHTGIKKSLSRNLFPCDNWEVGLLEMALKNVFNHSFLSHACCLPSDYLYLFFSFFIENNLV